MSNRNTSIMLVVLMLGAVSVPFAAASSINDMQGCQAMIGFVSAKIDGATDSYPVEDLAKIKSGLTAYNSYIQDQVISPGLLAFNGNDKAKAAEMQKQVDAYKSNLMNQLNARYPQSALKTDYALALDSCAKQAMPSGEVLKSLTESLQLMVKLAMGE